MEIKKKIGKRIQELRIKNNLKQAELAEKINIATKTQSCIETGKNFPTAENLEKYAKALDVEIAEILDIHHIKESNELYNEILIMLSNSDEEELKIIYKIVRAILY